MGETAAKDYPRELPVGYYLDNFLTLLPGNGRSVSWNDRGQQKKPLNCAARS